MTAYSTDLAMMSDFVTATAKVNETIAFRLNAVEERLAALHSQWHGAAAEQHQANARSWNQSMQQMRTELADLKTAVDSARSAYDDTVTHNQRMWP
jgi:WXG100 family type VII secretion target